jgi:hypothetical protein
MTVVQMEHKLGEGAVEAEEVEAAEEGEELAQLE